MFAAARDSNDALATEVWRYIMDLLLMLTDDGHSSDESGEDENGVALFRCHRLPWRRSIENILTLVDAARSMSGSLILQRGVHHVLRERPPLEDRKTSSRDCPKGFPLELVDKKWLEDAGDVMVRHYRLRETSFKFKTRVEDIDCVSGS